MIPSQKKIKNSALTNWATMPEKSPSSGWWHGRILTFLRTMLPPSDLKMEAAWSPDIVVSYHITMQCHNSGDDDLNCLCYENLASFSEALFNMVNV